MIKGDAKYHLEISENKDITFVHLSVINSILELPWAGGREVPELLLLGKGGLIL